MGILSKINEKIDRWLHKEEYELIEQRRAEGLPVTQEEYEAMEREEIEKMKRVMETEMKRILEEDHTRPPTQADINRYYTYHENYVSNMKGLEQNVGLWTRAPKEITRLEKYCDEAKEKGWDYLRQSCGMPTGDMSKPRSPWVVGKTSSDWSTQKTEEKEPETPKIRKRGV